MIHKKHLIIFIVLMAFVLAACGGSAATQQAEPTTAPAAEQPMDNEEAAMEENENEHIVKDEIIRLTSAKAIKCGISEKKLRLVHVYKEDENKIIEIITNQLDWDALTISELYKKRWDIELFFKAIKQNLQIKSFVGTSENAVMIQIWTALITILVLKYLKALSKFGWRLSNLVAFIRLNLFVKIELQKWLDKPFDEPLCKAEMPIQGVLF